MAKEISIEEADDEVVNALYQSAMSGNVRAMMFWLCNRQPNKWSMKPIEQEDNAKECGIVLMPNRGDHVEKKGKA